MIEARFRRVNLCKFIRHHRMVANRGGLSNCSRVELNCGVGYFAKLPTAKAVSEMPQLQSIGRA